MKMHYGLEEMGTILPQLLPVLIPVLIIQIIMMAVALVNLFKKELPFGDKVLWLIVIVCVGLIGPVVYFAVGSKMLDEKIANRNGDR